MDRVILLRAIADSLESTGRTNGACIVMDGGDRGDGLVWTHFTLFFPAGLSWGELHARDFASLRDAVTSIDRLRGGFSVGSLLCCASALSETWRLFAGSNCSRQLIPSLTVSLQEGCGADVDRAMKRLMDELHSHLRSIGLVRGDCLHLSLG